MNPLDVRPPALLDILSKIQLHCLRSEGAMLPQHARPADRKLVVNEPEAATVRTIFQRYAELGSVRLPGTELDAAGIVS